MLFMRFNEWRDIYAPTGLISEEMCKEYLKYLHGTATYQELIDDPNLIMLLVEKTLFWDFHGVLCPLKATSAKTIIPEDEYLGKFFNGQHPFEHRRPSRLIRTLMELVLDPKDQYLLSAVTSSREFDAEKTYMEEYYPWVPKDHYIAVAKGHQKALVMDHVYEEIHGHPMNFSGRRIYPMALIDDSIENLIAVEKNGYEGIHTSLLIP